MNATTMPKTVRELGNLAEDMGVTVSELLATEGFTWLAAKDAVPETA